jgi:hypothetical protein
MLLIRCHQKESINGKALLLFSDHGRISLTPKDPTAMDNMPETFQPDCTAMQDRIDSRLRKSDITVFNYH